MAKEELSHRLGRLALNEDDIVMVVRLENAKHHNFQPGIVINADEDDNRLAVKLLHGGRQVLKIKRRNLLRAADDGDRAALLTQVVWEKQLEMRVARQYLLDHLQGEEGLVLHIASFFPTRQTMAQTTGYAMGRIVPAWSCVTMSLAGNRCWKAVHEQQDGHRSVVYGVERVRDGIVRIDCAVVDIGSGRFVVAGGCNDHPSRMSAFFRSAFIYDSLTHVATPLPDMPCARHGCGGTYIDGKVYIIGGGYCDTSGTMGSVLDLATQRWEPLGAEMHDQQVNRIQQQLRHQGVSGTDVEEIARALRQPIAFVPIGGACGRLIIIIEGLPLAFHPADSAAGWQVAASHSATRALDLGHSAQASTEWHGHLIVASGRNTREKGCHVAALTFEAPLDAGAVPEDALGDGAGPRWARGYWKQLGAAGPREAPRSRVGGGLTVVHNQLYISGGVDEGARSSHFDNSVERWSGQLADLIGVRGSPDGTATAHLEDVVSCERSWQRVDDLNLPTAMHAHSAITIPWLPSVRQASNDE